MNKIKIQNRYTDFGTILNYKQKKFVKDFNNKERQFEMVKCQAEVLKYKQEHQNMLKELEE